MSLSIDRINYLTARATIIGWFAGMAYYAVWGSIELSFISWMVLLVGGMFGSSLVIGTSLTLLLSMLTRIMTGSWFGSPIYFSWGFFISPVLAFFSVKPAVLFIWGPV